jgi:hypothetical protein
MGGGEDRSFVFVVCQTIEHHNARKTRQPGNSDVKQADLVTAMTLL